MNIHYLKNSEISFKAWDSCIAGSFNGSLYAWSWYLNLICRQWDALVEDQYRSVMPLIIKRHWGRRIIDLPGLDHELGIFSTEPINASKTQAFIDAIPAQFRYYRIILNKYNPLESKYTEFRIQKKFELDLIKPYHKLAGDFNQNLRFKLNLAMAHHYNLVKGVSQTDLIRFITSHDIRLDKRLAGNNYLLLRMIITGLIRHKSGELFGLFDQHHQLASAGLFSWFNSRICLQFLVTDPGQLKVFPQLFLVDRFIEKYAETNSTLSFEYPLEPANPDQFTDFNARESHLAEIIRNNLPFFVSSPFHANR